MLNVTIQENRRIKVAVFGLGFVGLPLALSFALRGCKVMGVDINNTLVTELNNGVTHHLEFCGQVPIQQILAEQLAKGNFIATTDAAEAMANCDNIIVTVGIPVQDGEHCTSHLEECIKAVAQGLKLHDLVVIRSTLVPGMTRNFIKPLLETGGLQAGEDFHLAYSSERIAEGKAFIEFEQMPALVSGINGASLDRAMGLLGIVTKADIHPASSIEVVETAKVVENISRDVNIAMVNELARFTKAMGLDVFEVIQMANTHKRVNLLFPGPGVGGYCIPNALHYLAPKAEEMGVALELMLVARKINEKTPRFIVGMINKHFTVPLSEAKIAVLGLAMKDFSNDDRLSPALQIIWLMEQSGIKVAAYDPAVPSRYSFTVDTLEEAVDGAHGILVLARQREIVYDDFQLFRDKMSTAGKPFIVDTRNLYLRSQVEGAGMILESL
ncbi:MAG: nucleotide sugar dehydrogenase [Thermincolia bacterium]